VRCMADIAAPGFQWQRNPDKTALNRAGIWCGWA
jgi:hypothetical protein